MAKYVMNWDLKDLRKGQEISANLAENLLDIYGPNSVTVIPEARGLRENKYRR